MQDSSLNHTELRNQLQSDLLKSLLISIILISLFLLIKQFIFQHKEEIPNAISWELSSNYCLAKSIPEHSRIYYSSILTNGCL